jgi:hypothetical protein
MPTGSAFEARTLSNWQNDPLESHVSAPDSCPRADARELLECDPTRGAPDDRNDYPHVKHVSTCNPSFVENLRPDGVVA